MYGTRENIGERYDSLAVTVGGAIALAITTCASFLAGAYVFSAFSTFALGTTVALTVVEYKTSHQKSNAR